MSRYFDDELYHHGIQGQKWGVRRYQNADGTLTAAGRKRYGVDSYENKASKAALTARETHAKADRRIAKTQAAAERTAVKAQNATVLKDYYTNRAVKAARKAEDTKSKMDLAVAKADAKAQRRADEATRAAEKNAAKNVRKDVKRDEKLEVQRKRKAEMDEVKASRMKDAANVYLLSDKDLDAKISRLQKEKKLKELTRDEYSPYEKIAEEVVRDLGTQVAKKALIGAVSYGSKQVVKKKNSELAEYMFQNPNKKK